jgi:hypothetical protein
VPSAGPQLGLDERKLIRSLGESHIDWQVGQVGVLLTDRWDRLVFYMCNILLHSLFIVFIRFFIYD